MTRVCGFMLWMLTIGIGSSCQAQCTWTVAIDRGPDVGQAFGSLFEATSEDGTLVIGAGFQNSYNTSHRVDRHCVDFFVRPTDGKRDVSIEELPRPNTLCGTYLHSRDGTLFSLDGGTRAWRTDKAAWEADEAVRGETMRVGNDLLAFVDGQVLLNGEVVLPAPDNGSYQKFFYAHGHLCFYHVNRGDRAYRPYKDDADGFSKLHACPWRPNAGPVDLGKSVVLLLPIVGETTFA